MTKSELKTGMIVTTRNGVKYMVFKDAAIGSSHNSINVLVDLNERLWDNFGSYNEDMTCYHSTKFDIMKVETCQRTADLLHDKCLTTIWERKEKKRYTYAQLKEILGTEFEIVE